MSLDNNMTYMVILYNCGETQSVCSCWFDNHDWAINEEKKNKQQKTELWSLLQNQHCFYHMDFVYRPQRAHTDIKASSSILALVTKSCVCILSPAQQAGQMHSSNFNTYKLLNMLFILLSCYSN